MKNIKKLKDHILLLPILIISGILNLANLSIEGYANEYYAAGVKSMTSSLKNFFFVSFDPTSFVTIDKPPLGFWIQAISAKIFGFSGWSIILPQALAGVISVAVIYFMVKRSFGKYAGLISALILAVTPVFVADSRNNTCDNLLVLALLLACLALSVAAEKGKLKYVILSMAIIGIGFNIKMLQAYMVIPAIYTTYLLANAILIKKRIIHLAIGTLVLLLVSFSWAAVVDLVPSSSRPYVGSSTNNSELELIIGHNGLERLGLGSSTTGGGGGNKQGKPPEGMQMGNPPNGSNGSANNQGQIQDNTTGENVGDNNDLGNPPTDGNQNMGGGRKPPSGAMGGQKGMGGGGQNSTFGGSEPSSIFRLFSDNSLSNQIVWFLPLALIGFVVASIKEKLKLGLNNRRKIDLVLWIMWLVPVFIYFSFTTGLFHPYYLTMLAAPIAALAGIGITAMYDFYKKGGYKGLILPAAILIAGLVELLILSFSTGTTDVAKILMIIVAIVTFATAVVLIVLNFVKREIDGSEKIKKSVLVLALVGLLVTPTVCSATTLFYAEQGTFPAAGLSLISNKGQGGGNMGFSNNNNSSNSKLIEYLLSNKTEKQKYLLVTSSTTGNASEIVLKTGESVMALGGFFGTDEAITLSEFKELVNKGEIRYVMVGGMSGGSGGNNEIMSWVKENGTSVESSLWSNTATKETTDNNVSSVDTNENKTNASDEKNELDSDNRREGGFGGGNSEQLYDLQSSSKN
jgi:4-amino-4-deoxy-L-arabinose transferase-like glycosyltransferase